MWAHQPSPEGSQQFWVLKVTAGIAKSTTTPTHMTTSPVRSHRPNQAITHPYTVRLTKRFHSLQGRLLSLNSRPATRAEQPHHPHHATEPNGVQKSYRMVAKPDRKMIVPSYSALSIYWKSHSDPSSLQESLPCPDRLRDTAGTVKPLSARDQTTDQVGNDQAITRGFL